MILAEECMEHLPLQHRLDGDGNRQRPGSVRRLFASLKPLQFLATFSGSLNFCYYADAPVHNFTAISFVRT